MSEVNSTKELLRAEEEFADAFSLYAAALDAIRLYTRDELANLKRQRDDPEIKLLALRAKKEAG